MRRVIAALAMFMASVLLFTGCESGLSDVGEPLTIEQSELLAQTRFQIASRGTVVMDISVLPADDIDHLDLSVTVDFDDAVAWGVMMRGPESIAVSEEVAFTPETIATREGDRWQSVSFDNGAIRALAVVFALASDRPENALLLRQSGATYLGTVEVDGEQQSVFRVPSDDISSSSMTRLWLDDQGKLRRLDTGGDQQFVILMTDAQPQPRPIGLEGSHSN
ncbi:hypothetical protein [Microbacterium sp. GXS0129]|uniref:hypothetical protein n=1 Tax=Microbacterium sp. GXS0129 TaxID=3377836 RepID=UPI00383AB153